MKIGNVFSGKHLKQLGLLMKNYLLIIAFYFVD